MFAMKIIETERLILRTWKKQDLEPFANLNACHEVCKFLPNTLSKTESDALAEKIIAHFAEHGFGLFAIERKDNNQFIGFTGLSIPNFEAPFMPAVEIGWRISYKNWNQGFATEAAIAVCDYASSVFKLDEIISFTAKNNSASRKVMEKIGMKHNAKEDFNHPKLTSNHPLSRHVLYRKN